MITDYFDIRELVSPEIYAEKREKAWELFDSKLLDTLLIIRKQLNKPITINDWYFGGSYKLRGFRPMSCKIGSLKSAHKFGKAVDFDVKGMTAEEVRNWIVENKDKLPHFIRLEKNVNWVHLDVANYMSRTDQKIIFFEP